MNVILTPPCYTHCVKGAFDIMFLPKIVAPVLGTTVSTTVVRITLSHTHVIKS